jgi:3-oxoacyl-[acyl-carrier-protein] synthase-3
MADIPLITNEQLAERAATDGILFDPQRAENITGIKSRGIAPEGRYTSDLAIEAARKALDDAGVLPSQLCFIDVATMSPDHFSPAVASMVRDALGTEYCLAFDHNAACAGALQAARLAVAILREEPTSYALVVGADDLPRMLDKADRTGRTIFAAGAGAFVLGVRPDAPEPHFSTRGESDKRPRSIDAFDGGMRVPNKPPRLHMSDGPHVAMAASTLMSQVLLDAMRKAGMHSPEHERLPEWASTGVDAVLIHQPNQHMVTLFYDQHEVPENMRGYSGREHGNGAASTIPIGLRVMLNEGRLSENAHLALATAGIGFEAVGAVIGLRRQSQ